MTAYTRFPPGYLNDRLIAYKQGMARLGACSKHGGNDDPDLCEWCQLKALLNDEPCLFDD